MMKKFDGMNLSEFCTTEQIECICDALNQAQIDRKDGRKLYKLFAEDRNILALH
uniref:Uncharacterized protein n=1 Tax=Panagrolaimus sp. JU765 TaxID=591449 RepID=A0AC34RDB2_9BILA